MRPPITPQIRITSALTLFSIWLLILCVGALLSRWIGKSSPTRKLHGRHVLAWMALGWFAGGCVGVWILDNNLYRPGEADIGLAGFGFLIGWVIGMLHGGIVVWRGRRRCRP